MARRNRPGLTLLELMLALGLSVVLLSAVAMALRLYWRSFDVKRTNVEQAHLARAILDRMERDIHSAVQFTPVDLSGLEAMTSTANVASALGSMAGGGGAPGASGQGGSPSGAGGGGAAGGSPMGASPMGGGSSSTQQPMGQSGQGGGGGSTPMGGGATSGASTKGGASTTPSGGGSSTGNSASAPSAGSSGESTAVESTEGTPPAVVGLYGSEYELQFDISRLPRIDEYAGSSPTSMVQIPSDIKTVTYYVRSDSAAGGGPAMGGGAPAGSMEPSTTGQGRGLVRMEMDRAVSAFDESSGTSSIGKENARLLAEEVTSITFRYWNGTEWATDWNSDDSGGLPLAIEVVMTMADPNAIVPTGPPTQTFGAPEATTTDTSYRIVVNLPTASLPPPAEEPAEGDAAAAESESTAASGNSASGSPASSGSGATSGATSGSSGGQSGAKK